MRKTCKELVKTTLGTEGWYKILLAPSALALGIRPGFAGSQVNARLPGAPTLNLIPELSILEEKDGKD